jgi:CubicO group peptidase (beta-lactamase class C family)
MRFARTASALSGVSALIAACAQPNLHSVAIASDPSCHVVPPGVEDLGPALEPLRRAHKLPALAAAIVTPDTVEALGVAGFRKAGDPTAVCVADPFHLGSDTKALTAVVLASLIEQGKLTWQTRIRDVLADVPDQNPPYADVTLDQLLSHRAGFAHDPSSVSIAEQRHWRGVLHAQRERYVAAALHEAPASSPGSTFLYSNTGYVVAGLIAERVTQRSWEELVRERIFDPLAMPSAGFGCTASPGRLDGPWAHHMVSDEPQPVEPGPDSDNPLLIAPAGSVHTSIEGWARFVQDALAGLEGHGRLLSAASYETLYATPFGGDYAHGWIKVHRPHAGGVAYMHAGSNTLNFAVAWLFPGKRVAVVVATNAGSGRTFEACDNVVGQLMKRHAAREKTPKQARVATSRSTRRVR